MKVYIHKSFFNIGGSKLLKSVINMIYPRCCPVCSKIVIPRDCKVCPQCKYLFKRIVEPRCKKCSKPIENEEKEYCFDCSSKNLHYIRGYAIWVYDDIMKKSISGYKFAGKKEYADYYVEEMITSYADEIHKIKPDCLIPIPIHRSKLRKRGFNQAELIAKGIAKELNIPIFAKTLIRNKKTLPQKGLNDKERLKNLMQAFSFSNKDILNYTNGKLNKVILIDDIYTTGSTIEACTKVLIESGVHEVYFLCICIGKGF